MNALLTELDNRSKIATFVASNIGAMELPANRILTGPLMFGGRDGRQVGWLDKIDFDQRNNRAILKATIDDANTREMLEQGVLSNLVLPTNGDSYLTDRPTNPNATFKVFNVGKPFELVKSFNYRKPVASQFLLDRAVERYTKRASAALPAWRAGAERRNAPRVRVEKKAPRVNPNVPKSGATVTDNPDVFAKVNQLLKETALAAGRENANAKLARQL